MTTRVEIDIFHRNITGSRSDNKRDEQRIDQSFFLDNYDMPLIKDPKYQIRTGYVAGMLNGISSQMIGKNPRCFTKPRSDENESTKEAAARVATESNRWLKSWLLSLKNPFRQTFKTNNMYGETWIYMVHDQDLANF